MGKRTGEECIIPDTQYATITKLLLTVFALLNILNLKASGLMLFSPSDKRFYLRSLH
jgi:hypothetical protein